MQLKKLTFRMYFLGLLLNERKSQRFLKNNFIGLANNMSFRLFLLENTSEDFNALLSDNKVIHPKYWKNDITFTYRGNEIFRICNRLKINNSRHIIKGLKRIQAGVETNV